MLIRFQFTLLSFLFTCCTSYQPTPTPLEKLKVEVSPLQNREFTYSNKNTAFFYGRTHQDNFQDLLAGWCIDKKRIFSDYTLYTNNEPLIRPKAQVEVMPHVLVRKWNTAQETLALVDDLDLIWIELTCKNDSISETGIYLHGLELAEISFNNGIAYFKLPNDLGHLLVAPSLNQELRLSTSNILHSTPENEGFILAFAKEPHLALQNIQSFRLKSDILLKRREERMDYQVTQLNPFKSSDPFLDKSIAWLTLTNDLFISKRLGNGMYTGTLSSSLITGQFATTKSTLLDFSKHQDLNPKSPTYGLIPNTIYIKTPLYNSVNATPRFIKQVKTYLDYTGDLQFLRQIYPTVKLGINASYKRIIKNQNFIISDDGKTPRFKQTNTTHILWYNQLMNGAIMATYMDDLEYAARWYEIARKIQLSFEKQFSKPFPKHNTVHLNKRQSSSSQFRPNKLYTLNFIRDNVEKRKVVRDIWAKLVFPWGITSLKQQNGYIDHKKETHDSESVCLCDNSTATSWMLEFGQVESAYKLFECINKQVLFKNFIGGLPEKIDYLDPNKSMSDQPSSHIDPMDPCSNAEQLRVWYEDFLGINPQMMSRLIVLKPQIPKKLSRIEFTQQLASGNLEVAIHQTDEKCFYRYTLNNEHLDISLEINNFETIFAFLNNGETIELIAKKDKLEYQIIGTNGEIHEKKTMKIDPDKLITQQENDQFFLQSSPSF